MIKRKNFENYEEAIDSIKSYDFYIGTGNKSIGIKVSHNPVKKSLEFGLDLIRLNSQ